MRYTHLVGVTSSVFFLSAALAVPPELAPLPRPTEGVADLIRQLNSDEFDVRQRATARLSALDVPEPPEELLRAAVAAEPEVQRLAESAVRAIVGRNAARRLAPAAKFAGVGAVDRFVASTAGWDGVPDDHLWHPVRYLAHQLIRRSGVRGLDGMPHSFMATDDDTRTVAVGRIRSHLPHRMPERLPGAGHGQVHEAVIAPGVTGPVNTRLVAAVSRGPVRVDGVLEKAVVLADGDVSLGVRRTQAESCSYSVVVADGDVEVGDRVSGALIIARGNIVIHGFAESSVLVAGGRVTIKNPLTFGKHEDGSPDGRENRVEENQPRPFGWVTWFELADVGAEAMKVDGGVRVTALTAGKPFAAAGVQKDDVVTRVGRDYVATPEELRRRLRDAHATAGAAVLTVRRPGLDTEVKVSMPN